MNVAQQLFALFFAIFWGTSSNAWPRWRPFHWPFVLKHKRLCARAFVSLVLLNFVPVLYFAWMLYVVSGADPSNTDGFGWWWLTQAGRGIGPAFGIFGLYRIWMAVIGARPDWFYHTWDELNQPGMEEIRDFDPPRDGKKKPPDVLEPLFSATKTAWVGNLIAGGVYLLVGIILAYSLSSITWPTPATTTTTTTTIETTTKTTTVTQPAR